jgi:hypothetical protein
MKRLFIIILPVLAIVFSGCTPQKIIREKIEWSDFWWANEPDITKPRVLFIGNSISRGYFSSVSYKLGAKFNCDRYSTSRSIVDPALYKETRVAMAKYNHVVIHLNSGLHGMHLTTEEYRRGLEKYVRFLKSKKTSNCILVYSLTTPIPSDKPGEKLNPKSNQIVIDRNRVAKEIMEENEIPVIDLYGVVEPELERYSNSKGDVHYNKVGYGILAARISGEILRLTAK